jgi:NlpC/P60 family
MNEPGFNEAKLDELGRNSKRAALLSLLGFLLILGSMAYAALKVRRLTEEKQKLEQDVTHLRKSISDLRSREADLRQSQIGILNFLGGVTSGEEIRLIDRSVDWSSTKANIIGMPSGARKDAVLDALLLAWKDLPFSLGNDSLAKGLDSPHFIDVVLQNAGIHVAQRAGERLSDAMMREFERVNQPLPGDLIFYHGNVGSFVLMYIGPGSADGKGVAVGTLQTGEEIQVVDTKNINTPAYPFIGYFRVPYPSSVRTDVEGTGGRN